MILLSSSEFFKINFLQKILSGTLSECHMVRIQNVGPVLDPNCLQRLSGSNILLKIKSQEI